MALTPLLLVLLLFVASSSGLRRPISQPNHERWGRRQVLLSPVVTALSSALSTAELANAAAAPTDRAAPTVTDREYFDIRVITRYDVEVLEDAALRGRFIFSLFGKDAPRGVEKFLQFVEGVCSCHSRTLQPE